MSNLAVSIATKGFICCPAVKIVEKIIEVPGEERITGGAGVTPVLRPVIDPTKRLCTVEVTYLGTEEDKKKKYSVEIDLVKVNGYSVTAELKKINGEH